MNLRQIVSIIKGIFLTSNNTQDSDLDIEVQFAFSADLMSDVLRFGHEDVLLITGLTNPQVIRTAEMLGIRALLFVRAKLPSPEMVALAKEAGITLMATQFTMYESSGLLYRAGLSGLGSCGDFYQAS